VHGVADEVRTSAEDHHRRLVVAAASSWEEKYPDVHANVNVTTEPPAPALIEWSSDAALVVVGSRGLGTVCAAPCWDPSAPRCSTKRTAPPR
jgi:hypothetical protein